MKKILLALMLALFLAVPAFGAGTVVETIDYKWNDVYGDIIVLRYAITADASAGTVPDTTISLRTIDDTTTSTAATLKNYFLFGIYTTPGSGGAQPDAYTVDIKDSDGFSILDVAARSQTEKEWVNGYATLGQYQPIVGDLTLSVGDLGNSNTTEIEVYILK